jgi:hypothetical protein
MGGACSLKNVAADTNLIKKGKVNNETVIQFQLLLNNETWESLYEVNDTNTNSNSF